MKNKFLTLAAFLFLLPSSYSQVNGGCTPNAFCGLDKITSVAMTTRRHTNNYCNSSTGYSDYSNSNFFYAKPGQSMYAEVAWVKEISYNPDVWIDWNNNNDFTDLGEHTKLIAVGTEKYANGHIEVPDNVTTGDTLLVRVGLVVKSEPVHDPCSNNAIYSSVEFEDYAIIIGNDPDNNLPVYCESFGTPKNSINSDPCDDYLLTNEVYIKSVSIDSQWTNLNNKCSTHDQFRGYSDYTSDYTANFHLKKIENPNVSTGITAANYVVKVDLHLQSSVFSDSILANCKLWIDINGNQIFEPSEEIVYSPHTSTNDHYEFPIDMSNLTHCSVKTRMRIIGYMQGTQEPVISPCEEYPNGETEDYLVLININEPAPWDKYDTPINSKKTDKQVSEDLTPNGNLESTFEIYPNPVTSQMLVKVDTEKDQQAFFLKDLSGRTLQKMILFPGENEVNLQELNTGIYLLENEFGFIQKVVKK